MVGYPIKIEQLTVLIGVGFLQVVKNGYFSLTLSNPLYNFAWDADAIRVNNEREGILLSVLQHFWSTMTFSGQNIFCVLRNQLAHSEQSPINRDYAEEWMTRLDFDGDASNPGI